MKVKVYVTLKNGVLDPQGSAIVGTLGNLGISEIKDVRQGKFFELEVNSNDKAQAEKIVENACEKLLANTVIENYKIEA
jgi:phosphoribosylformylglycinamidine synthase PurS subunit